jgi:hypothetical protein
MLQLTIQGLEMQCATLRAVREISNIKPDLAAAPPAPKAKSPSETEANANATDPLQAAMWPWALMQQIQTQMQQATEQHVQSLTPDENGATKTGKNTP